MPEIEEPTFNTTDYYSFWRIGMYYSTTIVSATLKTASFATSGISNGCYFIAKVSDAAADYIFEPASNVFKYTNEKTSNSTTNNEGVLMCCTRQTAHATSSLFYYAMLSAKVTMNVTSCTTNLAGNITYFASNNIINPCAEKLSTLSEEYSSVDDKNKLPSSQVSVTELQASAFSSNVAICC